MNILDRLSMVLVVLPSAPKVLQLLNPSINFILGNSKTVRTLIRLNLHGLAVCKRLQVTAAPKNSPGTSVSEVNPEVSSHGCMFVPAPNFDKVIIVKNVSDLSKDESVRHVTASTLDQLQCLDHVIQQLKEQSDGHFNEIDVHFIFSFKAKVKKSSEYDKLKSETKTTCKNLWLMFDFVGEKGLERKLSNSVRRKTHQSEMIQKLISHCVKNMDEKFYHLNSNPLKLFSSEPVTVGEVDKIVQLFDFYFPDRHKKVQFIPDFNQIEDNMLYAYKADGELGNFCDYSGYLGEVRRFSQKLLTQLGEPKGIFLKSFSSNFLKTLLDLDCFAPQQFEIDWLYLGSQHIVAIEVGMSQNSQQPKTAIQNKLKQLLEKTIPQAQMILYSFSKSFQENKEQNFEEPIDLIKECLKFVMFLPDVKISTFVRDFEIICRDLENLMKHQNKKHLCTCLFFLVEDDKISSNLRLVGLSEQFELINCDYMLPQFFNHEIAAENRLFKYFCSLLSFSSLKSVNIDSRALEVDQRFFASWKKWFQKRKENDSSGELLTRRYEICSNLILSPQQYRILFDSKKTHLIITGQPGSGKTTLLLAKCEELTYSESLEKIYFIYSEEKILFKKYLKKALGKCCSRRLENEITLVGLQPQNLYSFVAELKNVT